MKEEYIELLTKFDISPTAARAYIALLELGKSSADGIAKRTNTYKANVYSALDKLMEAGLASYIFEGKKKLYIPTSPEKLPLILEESKQKTLDKYEETKKQIDEILPILASSYSSVREKDIFEVYKGKKGYKAMILEILREKPKYWKGFGNLQVQEYFSQYFPRWFKGVNIMLFSTKSEVFLKRLKEARKATKVEIKWLPEELYMPIVWTLFGDNLLILLYKPDIIALRIKSEQIVKTFSNQFDYLWKKS